MTHPTATPAWMDDLIERCRHTLEHDSTPGGAAATILADLATVRDHLIAAEQTDLGEWIRDLPPEQLGDFLADMEVSARQADADSDIGAFISAVADWQTSAQAARNGWSGGTDTATN
ncbi:MAG: hypothetical protein AAGE98_16025 [Actinomycetota bacterium]